MGGRLAAGRLVDDGYAAPAGDLMVIRDLMGNPLLTRYEGIYRVFGGYLGGVVENMDASPVDAVGGVGAGPCVGKLHVSHALRGTPSVSFY
jgi:hypothetical protein